MRDRLIRGADIGMLSQLESLGKQFSDEQGTRPLEQILADHGVNLVRQRLWVDPPHGFNHLADVAAMALRAKRAGLQFMLDLHYSDFWADPAKQWTPASWAGQDLATLAETVRSYTSGVLRTLAEQGTAPDIVQIGNEITNGMLWPNGAIYVDGVERWSEFTTLLKAGIVGAREAGSAQIMVHIDRGGDPDAAQLFYDRIAEHGVEYDLIGLSYYPFWHGPVAEVRTNLHNLAERFGKPINIVETAYPWTLVDHDGSPNAVGPDLELPADYPPTIAGQTLFLRDLTKWVAETPGDLGHGVVYWEPAWLPGVGWEPGAGNVWDNLTLFDPEGRALSSLDALGSSSHNN